MHKYMKALEILSYDKLNLKIPEKSISESLQKAFEIFGAGFRRLKSLFLKKPFS